MKQTRERERERERKKEGSVVAVVCNTVYGESDDRAYPRVSPEGATPAKGVVVGVTFRREIPREVCTVESISKKENPRAKEREREREKCEATNLDVHVIIIFKVIVLLFTVSSPASIINRIASVDVDWSFDYRENRRAGEKCPG